MKSEEVKAMDRQTTALEKVAGELKNLTKAVNAANTNIVEALAALRPEKEESQDVSRV